MTKNRGGGGASRVFKRGAVIPDAVRGDEELREKESDLESQGNPAAIHPQGNAQSLNDSNSTLSTNAAKWTENAKNSSRVSYSNYLYCEKKKVSSNTR